MRALLVWSLVAAAAALTAATEDAPPGLVATDSDRDLDAEATETGAQAQKRDAGLSNSYGQPLPADAYGPPADVVTNLVSDQHLPAPVYGIPFQDNAPQDTPPGAYGPPSPVVFPSQGYEGPPPPAPPDTYGPPKETYGTPKQSYGPPKAVYGPPKPIYGPPKPVYGPPKKIYGPPKQTLPKPTYGIPFKSTKFTHTKPAYGPPKPVYGPPKPVYGPPKPVYGPPKPVYGPPKPVYGPPKPIYGAPESVQEPSAIYGTPLLPEVPSLPVPELSAISLPQSLNIVDNVGSVNLGVNLQTTYGTPFPSLPNDLKPNFPILSDTYGPPGIPLGPNDNILLNDIENVGHYGPPQPDPNPKPPHPGIPAPPTPPHVHYDGWKPIPGVSLPINSHVEQNIDNQYALPPPPPPPSHNIHLELGGQALPYPKGSPDFSGAQITTGYSNVHHDALANIDLSAITGGDTNHIDQSKTVFEAHYTVPSAPESNLAVVHATIPTAPQQPFESYGAPILGIPSGSANVAFPSTPEQVNQNYGTPIFDLPLSNPSIPIAVDKPTDSYGTPIAGLSFSNSLPQALPLTAEKIPGSHGVFTTGFSSTGRHHGSKGLISPSGVYGVPPGSQYGAPPKPPPPHLPIPYGTFSGGGHSMHTGGNTPRRPIKFREPVPEGLFQQVAQVTNIKDSHSLDHIKQGSAYLPPPIRDAKEIQQTGNHGTNTISFSIEPSNLYSLPQIDSPVNFHAQHSQQPSNLYGSPIDSYSVPLLTVADNTASGSSTNSVTASIDGTILNNLTNLDVAAILRHCPYHEAIIKAAKSGKKIPADLAAKYVASLSSIGASLNKKSQQTLISPQNSFNTPEPGSESVSYSSKDLATASQSLVETVLPITEVKVKNSTQKAKSLKNDSSISSFQHNENLQKQILQTSEKIKNLSQQTNELQQKIVSASENLNKVSGQLNQYDQTGLPITGNVGGFTVQIQGSNGKGNQPSIPHEQLLSEGLLQSILQAIEEPQLNKKIVSTQNNNNINFAHSNSVNLGGFDFGGIDLPAGYEPIDRTKVIDQNVRQSISLQDQDIQASTNDIRQVLHSETVNNHRGSVPKTECELRADGSSKHVVVVPPPNVENVEPVEQIDDNDVAIFFGASTQKPEPFEKSKGPVTEISVATSISEDIVKRKDKVRSKTPFGKKNNKKDT